MKKVYFPLLAIINLAFAAQGVAQCTSATSLVVDLRFDNSPADSSLYNQTIFVYGSPTYETDRHGNAASALNTSEGSHFLYEDQTGEFKAPFPFTYSGWIQANALNVRNPVFMNEDHSSLYSGAWIDVLSNGQITANIGDGGAPALSNVVTATTQSAMIQVGQWFHVAVVFQSLSEIRIYVNGQLQNVTYSGTGSQLHYYMISGTAGKIGSGVNGTGTNAYFDGLIDDVRFWTTALVDYQIEALYDSDSDILSQEYLSMCENQSIEVSVPYEACDYYWSTGDNDATVTISGSAFGVGDHVVYARLYDAQNVVYTDSLQVSVSICTDVEDAIEGDRIVIYPNPSTGIVTLESSTATTFQLSNLLGEVMQTVNVNGKLNLDISHLSPGIYLLTDGSTGAAHKLVRE